MEQTIECTRCIYWWVRKCQKKAHTKRWKVADGKRISILKRLLWVLAQKRDCLKTMQTFDLDSHFHLPPALTLIAIVASTRSGSSADALEQRKVKPVLRVLPVVKYQTWRNLFILTHSIPWRWVNKASFSLAYCSNRPFVPLAQWKSWSEQISHFIVPSSDLKHITVTTNGRIMRVDKLFGLRRVDEFLAGIKCDAG